MHASHSFCSAVSSDGIAVCSAERGAVCGIASTFLISMEKHKEVGLWGLPMTSTPSSSSRFMVLQIRFSNTFPVAFSTIGWIAVWPVTVEVRSTVVVE
jgi:hypothetical protein